MKKIILSIALSLFFFACTSTVSALLVEECGDEEFLTNSSDYIIEGEVLDTTSQWNEDKTNIYTYNALKVLNVLKGSIREDNIMIKTEGGQVGEVFQMVSPEAFFREGDLVKVFLQEWNEDLVVVCAHYGVKPLQGEVYLKEDQEQEDRFVGRVSAAPSPTCEIIAKVSGIEKTRVEFGDGPYPREEFNFYKTNLDVFKISTYVQEGDVSCDDSYIERANQYGGYIVSVEEYVKNPILSGQKIRAKVHFDGDEMFRGYFLSDIIEEEEVQIEDVGTDDEVEAKEEKTENKEEGNEITKEDYHNQGEVAELDNDKEEKQSFIMRIINFIKSFFLMIFGK